MVQPPVEYLQPGEPVLLRAKRDPRSIVDAVLGWIVLGALPVVAGFVLYDLFPAEARASMRLWLILTGAAIWALTIPVSILRTLTMRYVVTEERIYKSYGRIRFNLLQTTYDKVTDLHVRQGPFGRMFGFGTVTLYTAGANLALPGIDDPFAVKVQLEEARSAFFRRLVKDHRSAKVKLGQGPRPGKAPAKAVAWTGQPIFASFLGRMIGAGFLLVPALVFLVLALFFYVALFVPAISLLAISAIMTLSLFLQYRFSHYEVTGQGVVVTTGWLGRRRVETTYNKVTDVTTTQSLLGRVLGYGDIKINTAGSAQAPVQFVGIADPESVKRIIDSARGVAS